MLKWRAVTALLLVGFVVWMLWWAPVHIVPGLFVFIGVVAAWEWARMIGLKGALRVVFTAAALLGLAACWWLVDSRWSLWPWLAAGLAVWLVALGQLIGYFVGRREMLPLSTGAVLGVLLLCASWLAIMGPFVRLPTGAYWLSALFVLVWGSDIGGYVAGRLLGRHKLAPRVSPAKTWEGAVGGIVLALTGLAVLIAVLDGWGYFNGAPPWNDLVIAPVVVAAAVLGDLFESMLKRQSGLKDSGNILPGHGGVLDRLDALLMAAPVYAVLSGLVG